MALIEVKKPVLLDAHLGDSELLYPTKGNLKLQMTGVSEATLTLGDKSDGIPMHAWVKIYNQLGLVGIFRRTGRDNNITVDKAYTLRHGIDILNDSVWDAETEFTGTKTEFLTQLLNHQTSLIQGPGDSSPRKPWVIGSCADTSSYTKKKINHDNLLSLLNGMVEEGSGYYFVYDQTVWPWTVSLVAKPSAVASEFRLSRNLEKCKIKDNDSELCTRLILSVNEMVDDAALAQKTGKTVKQNSTVVRTYNNTAAQAAYGIIVKTADIDVTQDTFPSGPFPEADAWAADFLARRAAPQLQVQIDGFVLKGITGEDWDESRIGTVCKVSLPDYPDSVSERCVTVTYPDLYGTPDKVTVSLANALPTFSKSVSIMQETVTKQGGAGRGAARQAESFDQHFEIVDDSGNVLRQAGLHLDANGMLVYANDNENMIGSKFEVQAERIGMVVGHNSGGNFIKAAEIAVAINDAGQGVALINADHVNISATNTAHLLAGSIVYDENGNLVLKESSGGGVYVEHNDQGTTAQFGVWDRGNLTGGVMVQEINGQSTLTLSADVIDVAGIVSEMSTMNINCTELTASSGIYCEADLECDGDLGAASLTCPDGELYVGSNAASWQTLSFKAVKAISGIHNFQASDSQSDVRGYLVTDYSSVVLNYLGR